MKRWLILVGIVVVLLIVTAASAVTQIKPGERGVVRRFGRIVATPGPGLYIGLPWGLDRVDREQVSRERRVTVGFDNRKAEDESSPKIPVGQLLTGDHNLVNLQVVVGYTLVEDEVAKFVLQADRADALIARAAEAALAQWNAGRKVDDVLLRGKRPDQLPAWMVAQLTSRIKPYDLGVRIERVDVTLLDPPAEVKSAFDAVARANTEVQTRINEAQQEAAKNLRSAEATIFDIERQTAAYQNEQYLQAKAEAENFLKRLEQYRSQKNNPQYLAGIWWDEMSRLFTRMRQNGRLDLLDHHLGPDGLDITQMPGLPKKQ
jgi:modulator of FtsH protease HflK